MGNCCSCCDQSEQEVGLLRDDDVTRDPDERRPSRGYGSTDPVTSPPSGAGSKTSSSEHATTEVKRRSLEESLTRSGKTEVKKQNMGEEPGDVSESLVDVSIPQSDVRSKEKEARISARADEEPPGDLSLSDVMPHKDDDARPPKDDDVTSPNDYVTAPIPEAADEPTTQGDTELTPDAAPVETGDVTYASGEQPPCNDNEIVKPEVPDTVVREVDAQGEEGHHDADAEEAVPPEGAGEDQEATPSGGNDKSATEVVTSQPEAQTEETTPEVPVDSLGTTSEEKGEDDVIPDANVPDNETGSDRADTDSVKSGGEDKTENDVPEVSCDTEIVPEKEESTDVKV